MSPRKYRLSFGTSRSQGVSKSRLTPSDNRVIGRNVWLGSASEALTDSRFLVEATCRVHIIICTCYDRWTIILPTMPRGKQWFLSMAVQKLLYL